MSTKIPDDEINGAIAEHQISVPGTVLRCLLRQLAAAIPIARDTPEIVAAETHHAAREMFFSMQPRDPAEAAAAVRAVTAHFAAMDMYARAARPGLSDETVMRLHTSANASARAANPRRSKTERAPAAAREAPAAPPPLPGPPAQPAAQPPIGQFQPPDGSGNAIPLGETGSMTPALEAQASPTNGDARQS